MIRSYNLAVSIAIGLLIALGITSCGGGGSGGSGGIDGPSIASIEVTSSNSLLTTDEPTAQLTARAFDADGAEVLAEFTWASSAQATIGVNDAGLATRLGGSGSSTITAIAGGITSNAVVLLAATPAAGAILVSDNQVTGEISISAPEATWGVGSYYEVTLTLPEAPGVGSILVGSGNEPIGGRVSSVADNGGSYTVVLEVIGLDQLFEELVISEQIDLTNEPYIYDQYLSDYYNLEEHPDGTVEFILKEEAQTPRLGTSFKTRARGTSLLNPEANFGPFTCTHGQSNNPFTLISKPAKISVSTGLTGVMEYDSHAGGLQKLMLTGTVDAKFNAQLGLAITLEEKVDCKFQVLELPLPVPAPLVPVLGAWAPLGVGFEAGGKLEMDLLDKVNLELEGGGSIEIGAMNNQATGWDFVTEATFEPEKPKFQFVPHDFTGDYVSTLGHLRLKPQVMLYGSADFELGMRGSRIIQRIVGPLRAQLATSKLGPKLSGDFAIVEEQISDTAYKSDYKLELEFAVGQGTTVATLLNRFGININAEFYKKTIPFATSPAASKIKADVASFELDDPVNFYLSLKPESVSLPVVGYNVEEVLLYKKPNSDEGETFAELIDTVTASNGQEDFTFNWVADEAGTIEGDFFAFVKTWLLPIPLLDELELGKAEPPGRAKLLYGQDDPFDSLFVYAEVSIEGQDTSNQFLYYEDRVPYFPPDCDYGDCFPEIIGPFVDYRAGTGGVPDSPFTAKASLGSPIPEFSGMSGQWQTTITKFDGGQTSSIEFSGSATKSQLEVGTEATVISKMGGRPYMAVDVNNDLSTDISLDISWTATGSNDGCLTGGYAGMYLYGILRDPYSAEPWDLTNYATASFSGGETESTLSGSFSIPIPPGRWIFFLNPYSQVGSCPYTPNDDVWSPISTSIEGRIEFAVP